MFLTPSISLLQSSILSDSPQYASNYESCEYGGGEASFWFIVHSSPALFTAFAHEALLQRSAKVRHTQQLTSRGLMCARSLWIWLTGSDDGSTAKATGWEKMVCTELLSTALASSCVEAVKHRTTGGTEKVKNKEITNENVAMHHHFVVNITLLFCICTALCGLLTWDGSGHLFVVIS